MDILTFGYAGLCALSVLLFQLTPIRHRPFSLSVASFLVFAVYSIVSSTVLLALTVAVFLTARILERCHTNRQRTFVLTGGIILLLSYLTLIKTILIMHHGYLFPGIQYLTAVGVSYFTFRLLGYLIDVYWGKYPACKSFVWFSSFVAFFPELPAGPIQRLDGWFIDVTANGMATGLRRILLGYVKKVVVANQLGSMVAFISSVQPEYSNLTWIAAYIYTIQLYADFSALTDIAIGIGSLFGVTSPENFYFPFFAPNISQFWRRWHMSLTNWLTDYVFTPLRMASRNLGSWGQSLSITVTMLLIGLWHGFTAGFLLFGLVHSVYLISDSLTSQFRRRYYKSHPTVNSLTNILGPIVVFHMMALSLVFFRADSWIDAIYSIQRVIEGASAPIASLIILRHGYDRSMSTLLALSAFVVWECILYMRERKWRLALALPRFTELPLVLRWATYYASLGIAVALQQTSTPFIYVQF